MLPPGSFRTETGSTYLFDPEENTLTRLIGASGDELRRDGDPLKIITVIQPAKLGHSAVFVLDLREDGIPTIRTTSAVVEVA